MLATCSRNAMRLTRLSAPNTRPKCRKSVPHGTRSAAEDPFPTECTASATSNDSKGYKPQRTLKRNTASAPSQRRTCPLLNVRVAVANGNARSVQANTVKAFPTGCVKNESLPPQPNPKLLAMKPEQQYKVERTNELCNRFLEAMHGPQLASTDERFRVRPRMLLFVCACPCPLWGRKGPRVFRSPHPSDIQTNTDCAARSPNPFWFGVFRVGSRHDYGATLGVLGDTINRLHV